MCSVSYIPFSGISAKLFYGESMTSLILSLINKLNTVFDQASLILLSLITKLDTVFDQQAWYCLWSNKLDTVFDQASLILSLIKQAWYCLWSSKPDTVSGQQAWCCLWSSKLDIVFDQASLMISSKTISLDTRTKGWTEYFVPSRFRSINTEMAKIVVDVYRLTFLF